MRRNNIVFILILILFALAIAVVLPMEGGTLFGRGVRFGLDLQGGIHLVYKADLSQVASGQANQAMDSAIAVIQKRVDVFGVTEPVIQRQGSDRILVELPGVSEADKAKAVIGQTAILEFGEVVTSDTEPAKWTNDLGKWKPAVGTYQGKQVELTSAFFKDNTYVTQDNLGRLILVFEWNAEGADLSGQITERMINQPLGIFFGDKALLGDDGRPIAPVVRAKITDRGQIEGLSSVEATELSKLLNAGRIPVPLTPIYEQSVTSTLGSNFVGLGLKAGIIGLILILLFMIIYYRLPGFLAAIALIFYACLVLAIFKLVPVTLSLAGLGGFITSLGMAVDANVLIFERIKEELRVGRTLGAAIEAGFSRAWSAIFDSNMTTFIACAIMYWLGSSVAASAPVTGFALTLFIGVAVSMFTAILVTRTFLRLFIGSGLAHKTTWFVPIFTKMLGGK